MARVRKRVISVGTYQSPDGAVVVTPARIKHWAAGYQRFTDSGLRVPVPWGHAANAFPEEPASAQFLASRFNAGYLDGAEVSPDGQHLDLIAEVPGAETDDKGNLVTWTRGADGREVKTAIGEVSIGIAKKFQDGRGRTYSDVITHVAITPHPVVPGQQGFTALSLAGSVEGLQTLSLEGTHWLGGSMAKDKSKPDEEEIPADPAAGDEPPADAEPPPAEPEAEETPAEPEEPEVPESEPVGEEIMGTLLPLLAAHGIVMPEDTTLENLPKHLEVALTALKGQLTPVGDMSGDMSGDKTTEEQPNQLLMSLVRENPTALAAAEAMQARLDAYERRDREAKAHATASRLTKLAANLPASVREKHFGADVKVVCLSLHEKPATELAAFDAKLSLLSDLQPYLAGKNLSRRLVNATEVVPPIERPDVDQKKITDEMAAMAGYGPSRNGTKK